MSSLKETDAAAAAVQKTPNRVSLEQVEANITGVEYINPESNNIMTIAVMTLQNGYVVIGKSAPADPDNYNEELGRKFAYEDAVRQVWPLMGYALREQLSNT